MLARGRIPESPTLSSCGFCLLSALVVLLIKTWQDNSSQKYTVKIQKVRHLHQKSSWKPVIVALCHNTISIWAGVFDQNQARPKNFVSQRFLKMVTLKLFPTMMCIPYHEGLKKRKVLLTIAPTWLISSWPRGIHWCWCPIRDVIWYKLFVWYNQSYAWSYVGYNQSYVQSIGYSMASQSG